MKMKSQLLCTLLLLSSITAFSQVSINFGGPKLNSKKKEKKEESKTENTGKEANTAKLEEAKTPANNEPAKAVEPVKTYTEEEKAKILDKANYSTYKADKEKLEQIRHAYRNQDLSVEKISQIKPSRDTLERIAKTYKEFWLVYEQDAGKPEQTNYLYKQALENIRLNEGTVYNYQNTAYREAKASLTETVELAEKKVETFTSESYKKWDDVDKLYEKAALYVAALKFMKGDNHAEVLEVLKKQETTLNKLPALKTSFMTKLSELEAKELALEMKELETVKMPAEIYKGADKEALRKKIIAANSDCQDFKLVKVILTDDTWTRDKGAKYHEGSGTYTNYDKSSLIVTFIIHDKKSAFGYIINDRIIKDHLSNTIDYTINPDFICDRVDYIKRQQKILMKNVK